jgi:creatinine deaminase
MHHRKLCPVLRTRGAETVSPFRLEKAFGWFRDARRASRECVSRDRSLKVLPKSTNEINSPSHLKRGEMTDEADQKFIKLAYEQALKSYNEGGLPIGAAMVESSKVIAVGHNRRVQDSDPIAHGEMDCFRKAGRRSRYDGITLYTTLSPCMMCSGTILQFGVKRVVIGEDRNFPGNIDFLRDHGVNVILLNDQACISFMKRFIKKHRDLWDEDIAGRTDV